MSEDEFKLPESFLITLAEEPWKETQTLSHLSRLDIHPTVVHGVQGVTIGLRATNPYDYDKHGSPLFMHISQIGCVLSHRLALSVAIAHGASEFIVMEDDVKLPSKFTLMFQNFREALPEDADVAQLIYRDVSDKPCEEVNDRVHRIHYPFQSSAIWWRRHAAQQALTRLRPVDRPFDIMLIQQVFPFLNHYVPAQSLGEDRSTTGEWASAVGGAPKVEA